MKTLEDLKMDFTKEIMDTFKLKTPEKCILKGCGNEIYVWSEKYDMGLCKVCYYYIIEDLEK